VVDSGFLLPCINCFSCFKCYFTNTKKQFLNCTVRTREYAQIYEILCLVKSLLTYSSFYTWSVSANQAHLQATLFTPRSKIGAMRTPIKPIPFTFTCTRKVEVVIVCSTATEWCSSRLLEVLPLAVGARAHSKQGGGAWKKKKRVTATLIGSWMLSEAENVERGCDWQLQKVAVVEEELATEAGGEWRLTSWASGYCSLACFISKE